MIDQRAPEVVVFPAKFMRHDSISSQLAQDIGPYQGHGIDIVTVAKLLPRPRNSWVILGSALGLIEEAVEFAAGGIEGALLLFRAVVYQWAAVGPNHITNKFLGRDLSESRGVVQIANDFSTQQPEIVHVPANGRRGKIRVGQMLDEGPEANHQCFSWGQVFFKPHPGTRPVFQIAAVGGRRCSSTVYLDSLRLENRPHHGIDQDSKSLPSPSRVRLPARPLRSRPAKHRSGRPAAGGLGGNLFGVPPAGTRLRSPSPAALRVHPAVGLSGVPAVPHAARRVPELRRGRRGGSLVRW